MRISFLILFVLFCSFAFAASNLPDACKILTAQDVEKILGTGFQPSPLNQTTKEHSICGYTKGLNDSAAIEILQVEGMDGAAVIKELQKHFNTEGKKVVPVSDLGEGAFYMDAPNPITGAPVIITHFAKGPFHASVDVKVNGKHDADAEQKIAKAAYTKFP